MPNSLDNPICISWIDICLWPLIGKDVYLGPMGKDQGWDRYFVSWSLAPSFVQVYKDPGSTWLSSVTYPIDRYFMILHMNRNIWICGIKADFKVTYLTARLVFHHLQA